MTDQQDILDRITWQLYGCDADWNMVAILNLLEDAGNEIRRLRGEHARDAARWRHTEAVMCYSFDGENRTHYLKASGRESFRETIDRKLSSQETLRDSQEERERKARILGVRKAPYLRSDETTTLPQDGTIDGDGVWRGGKWHPNPPLMRIHSDGRIEPALTASIQELVQYRAGVIASLRNLSAAGDLSAAEVADKIERETADAVYACTHTGPDGQH